MVISYENSTDKGIYVSNEIFHKFNFSQSWPVNILKDIVPTILVVMFETLL